MPKAFISYSHDNDSHKDWVRSLAEQLIGVGIDVTLDQWDLRLGEDVARFMETGIRDHDRVIVVCSERYTAKADAGIGGVGFEKQIVTAELVRDLATTKFIPIIRGNPARQPPACLGYRRYVDFDDDTVFTQNLELLRREVLGVPDRPKPKLGANPYVTEPASAEQQAVNKLPSDSVYPVFKVDRVRFEEALCRVAGAGAISELQLTWIKTDGDVSTAGFDIELLEVRKPVSPGVTRLVYRMDAGWDAARDAVYQAWLDKVDLEVGSLASTLATSMCTFRLGFVSVTDPDSMIKGRKYHQARAGECFQGCPAEGEYALVYWSCI